MRRELFEKDDMFAKKAYHEIGNIQSVMVNFRSYEAGSKMLISYEIYILVTHIGSGKMVWK